MVWDKLGVGEISGANLALALGALVSITAGTLYQKRFLGPCDVRAANLVQLVAAFAVTILVLGGLAWQSWASRRRLRRALDALDQTARPAPKA